MSQRSVELIIGRLIADESFRIAFVANPTVTLIALREQGVDLTGTEIAAIVDTDPEVWMRAADTLDPRLQKVALGVR